MHISGVKYILPTDNVISKMPDYQRFGREGRLRLNPNQIPYLECPLSTSVNNNFSVASNMKTYAKSEMCTCCTNRGGTTKFKMGVTTCSYNIRGRKPTKVIIILRQYL